MIDTNYLGLIRMANPVLAQFAADHRADDETQAEGGADQPETMGAFVGRGDVGHVALDGQPFGRVEEIGD